MVDLSHITRTEEPQAFLVSPSLINRLCTTFQANGIEYQCGNAMNAVKDGIVEPLDDEGMPVDQIVFEKWPKIMDDEERYPEAYQQYDNPNYYTHPEDNIVVICNLEVKELFPLLVDIYRDPDVDPIKQQYAQKSMELHGIYPSSQAEEDALDEYL